jgi:hypothetical protein
MFDGVILRQCHMITCAPTCKIIIGYMKRNVWCPLCYFSCSICVDILLPIAIVLYVPSEMQARQAIVLGINRRFNFFARRCLGCFEETLIKKI